MKLKFPLADAVPVANWLVTMLDPVCLRVQVAGSIRRRKPEVGDVEILFIPRLQRVHAPQGDLFTPAEAWDNAAEKKILELEQGGLLARRKTATGRDTYGPKNKLMVHVATGIPVDLFTATEQNWFNLLVCRTGPAESNTRIASAAQWRGWKWTPYGLGFTRVADPDGGLEEVHRVGSEQDVFDFVGLPFKDPQDRH